MTNSDEELIWPIVPAPSTDASASIILADGVPFTTRVLTAAPLWFPQINLGHTALSMDANARILRADGARCTIRDG